METPPRVLVIEDDPRLRSYLDRALASAGYRVGFDTATEAHAVLLNRCLNGRDGLELLRQLRAVTDVPLFMLTNLDSVDERVAALDAGADDVMALPFATEELLARMRAALRGRALAKSAVVRNGRLSYADLSLDLDTREVVRGERKLEVRNKALELLACFMRHPERVLSRRDLLGEVWGFEFLGDSNVIEVTVSHLRQALEAAGEPRLIHTVRPVGYILDVR